mgnify:CR=1 FL=1
MSKKSEQDELFKMENKVTLSNSFFIIMTYWLSKSKTNPAIKTICKIILSAVSDINTIESFIFTS